MLCLFYFLFLFLFRVIFGMFFVRIMGIAYVGFPFLSKPVISSSTFGLLIFSHIFASFFIFVFLWLFLFFVFLFFDLFYYF